MADHDLLTVQYTPAGGPRRRVTFEWVPGAGWTRRMSVWTGCSWRQTGTEPVEDLAIGSNPVLLKQ